MTASGGALDMSLVEIDKINELKELASIFNGYCLYAVGGIVRNALTGLPLGDIDIASNARIESVKTKLDGTNFDILAEYPRTGTLVLGKGKFKAEFTTFREDSYPIGSGVHAPESVKFTDDIIIDAKRRDFTVNAIYYDIEKGVVFDPLGGVGDIKNGILRTADVPDKTMGQDALRIMRLLRFKAEFGFEIEDKTRSALLKYSPYLKEISRERITCELLKTLTADTKYPRFSAGNLNKSFVYTINEYNDCGLFKTVFGIEEPSKYIDLINAKHGLTDRLAAIYCDADNFDIVMRELKFPMKIIEKVCKAIAALHAEGDDYASFIIEHADGYRHAEFMMNPDYTAQIDAMLAKNVPVRIADLKINGNDAAALGLKGADIGKALKRVLYVAITKTITDRDGQLEELKKL